MPGIRNAVSRGTRQEQAETGCHVDGERHEDINFVPVRVIAERGADHELENRPGQRGHVVSTQFDGPGFAVAEQVRRGNQRRAQRPAVEEWRQIGLQEDPEDAVEIGHAEQRPQEPVGVGQRASRQGPAADDPHQHGHERKRAQPHPERRQMSEGPAFGRLPADDEHEHGEDQHDRGCRRLDGQREQQ